MTYDQTRRSTFAMTTRYPTKKTGEQMLQILLEDISDWQEKSNEELLEMLTAPQMIPKQDAMISIATIQGLYGVPVGEAIYQALLESGAKGTAARFAATGLNATDPQWQEYADKIAKAVPSLRPLYDAIKYIGFDRRSLWEMDGNETELTIRAIEEEKDRYKNEAAMIEIQDRANAAVEAAAASYRQGNSAKQITKAGEVAFGGG